MMTQNNKNDKEKNIFMSIVLVITFIIIAILFLGVGKI